MDHDPLPPMKFGIGQPVARKEDPYLVAGHGRYTDDVDLPGQAYGVVLRSPQAHGSLRRIDSAAARAAPGVLAVYTGADLRDYGPILCKLPLKSQDGSPLFAPPRPVFATDRVRYVGEPLALVVAESIPAAQDAAELIELEIASLPAVADAVAALAADAPRLHDDQPNLCLDWGFGDRAAAERAFASAAHVTRLRLVSNRIVVAAMEPRAAVADYEAASDRFTLHVGCQGVFGLRRSLAEDLLKIEPERLHVLTGNVGGSFGMKSAAYPEYVAILHAARELGRPVKWCDPRSGSFLSDQHGRGTVVEAELALDAEGNFLAVRVSTVADMGAYLTAFGPAMPAINMQKNLPSLYRTPVVAIRTRCAFTNTVPIGPYRGAGRPEANYVMERLVDTAARETGHDPVELRHRNLIPQGAMPWTAASGLDYDSGDFAAVLEDGLAKADWAGFPERRRQSEARGRLRGRGLACYLEVTAPSNPEMGGIRFEDDGRVTVITGTLDYGQGHASPFAQVLASRLGVPFELIDLVQGDSDQLLVGGGTGGSRSIMSSGKAIVEASAEVIDKGRRLASHFLEAAAADTRSWDRPSPSRDRWGSNRSSRRPPMGWPACGRSSSTSAPTCGAWPPRSDGRSWCAGAIARSRTTSATAASARGARWPRRRCSRWDAPRLTRDRAPGGLDRRRPRVRAGRERHQGVARDRADVDPTPLRPDRRRAPPRLVDGEPGS